MSLQKPQHVQPVRLWCAGAEGPRSAPPAVAAAHTAANPPDGGHLPSPPADGDAAPDPAPLTDTLSGNQDIPN